MKEERETTQELMNELTDRLIIPLEKNEILCPTCKGLRMILKQNGDKEYIETCSNCYNGKLYVCKYCGKKNKTDCCDCKESQHERDIKFNLKQSKRQQELFEKAKKIQFADYHGYFILDGEEFVRNPDEVYDWLYNQVECDKVIDGDLPKFLWATSPEPVFTLDLQDIIHDKCEDGYEDMELCLDIEDEELQEAQKHLYKWYGKQGDSVNTYYQNTSIAILLNDVIEEIKRKIKNEKYKV